MVFEYGDADHNRMGTIGSEAYGKKPARLEIIKRPQDIGLVKRKSFRPNQNRVFFSGLTQSGLLEGSRRTRRAGKTAVLGS